MPQSTPNTSIMRHLLSLLLVACVGAASAQVEPPEPLTPPDLDMDLLQGFPAWLVGDHVTARRHFRAAAQRGDPLGQYNLAMMLLYREGGRCGVAEAIALLRKAAKRGVELAGDALEQIEGRGVAQQPSQSALPCLLYGRAPSTTAAAIGSMQRSAAP